MTSRLLWSSVTVGISLLLVGTVLGADRGLPAKDDCVQSNPQLPEQKLVHFAIPFAKFHDEYNKWFVNNWKCTKGQTVVIEQSYAASGDIMRGTVAGSLRPDIFSMSHPFEIDTIVEKTGIISSSWRNDFAYDSSPYRSAVVFLVRKGNPKNIKDWGDLIQPDLTILVSNPKTCGGGRWVYTGALGFAGSGKAEDYVGKFYKNVPVSYANQAVAGNAFLSQNIGDVLVTYESAALLEAKKANTMVELVSPSRTVAIDISVAIAIKNTDQNKTTDIAKAYVRGLYDPDVQKLMASNFIRPRVVSVMNDVIAQFPKQSIYVREEVFGLGDKIEKEHLLDGGIYDVLVRR